MLVSLRSTIIEGGGFKEETDSFLAENALETHCFVLGGNEFRLRVLVCDAKRNGSLLVNVYIRTIWFIKRIRKLTLSLFIL